MFSHNSYELFAYSEHHPERERRQEEPVPFWEFGSGLIFCVVRVPV